MHGSRSIPLIAPSPSLPPTVIEGDRIRKQRRHAVLPIRRSKTASERTTRRYIRRNTETGLGLPRPKLCAHAPALRERSRRGYKSRRSINGARSTDGGELANGTAMGVAMVQLGGLEPPTSCSTDRRSNQLSYNCIRMGRPTRGRPNGPETRCNGRIWQGRERIKSPAVTAFFDAASARTSPRANGEPQKANPAANAPGSWSPAVHAGTRPVPRTRRDLRLALRPPS